MSGLVTWSMGVAIWYGLDLLVMLAPLLALLAAGVAVGLFVLAAWEKQQ